MASVFESRVPQAITEPFNLHLTGHNHLQESLGSLHSMVRGQSRSCTAHAQVFASPWQHPPAEMLPPSYCWAVVPAPQVATQLRQVPQGPNRFQYCV